MGQNECAAGGLFIAQGDKFNMFEIVYILLGKSEGTDGSKRMCGWGYLYIPGG